MSIPKAMVSSCDPMTYVRLPTDIDGAILKNMYPITLARGIFTETRQRLKAT